MKPKPKPLDEELADFVQVLQNKSPEELKNYIDSRFGLFEDLLVFVKAKERSKFFEKENFSLRKKVKDLQNQILDLQHKLFY